VTGSFYEEATGRTIGGGFRLRRQLRMRPETADGPAREVFGASGAAVLFRRAALDEAADVTGEIYDDRYFSYGEDIDLAWRLRSLGWTVRYTPDARAHHVGSGSLGGALRFLEALWPYLCLRQPLRVPHLLGGIADVLRLLPGTWRRRRLLQARSRLGSRAVRPWLHGL
jgi:GT2 family glycosyltransferase